MTFVQMLDTTLGYDIDFTIYVKRERKFEVGGGNNDSNNRSNSIFSGDYVVCSNNMRIAFRGSVAKF
ncbi:hypothetical protein [Jeotgalibaca porci]|uniref:hypothetical protein n=1 Tax=Jeotgalibaca porci TaxID=1868793 RepID=UPI00359F3282